jgi:hypothetical protein
VLNHASHAKILPEIIKAVLDIQNVVLQEIYNAVKNISDKKSAISILLKENPPVLDVSIRSLHFVLFSE